MTRTNSLNTEYIPNPNKLWRIYSNHKSIAFCYHMLTGKLWNPMHMNVVISDIFNHRSKPIDNISHCKEAIKWIFRAQDMSGVGGISAEYNFSWGWCLPYPEVSGYIIPTMLNYANRLPDGVDKKQIEVRTRKIADWLVQIQNPDGSYNSGWYYDRKVHGNRPLAQRILASGKPCAFETGQILWGLSAIYEYTHKRDYFKSAIKAADWLVSKQSNDGSWIENQDVPMSFSAFTARHLASLAEISGCKKYEEAAIRNCNWCLSRQNNVGWFDNCSHDLGIPPWTHGIGYATQGLLEVGILLNNNEYIDRAMRTADKLLKVYYLQEQKLLPARLDNNWKSSDKFTCLAGNAQISSVWSILYKVTGDMRYLIGVLEINQDLKSLQILGSDNAISGGIKGSNPIWGFYKMFSYPAWATKFFVDALLLEDEILKDNHKRLVSY